MNAAEQLSSSVRTISQQMLGQLRNKTLVLINTTQDVLTHIQKSTRILTKSSISHLSSSDPDVIFGIDLWGHLADKKNLLQLKKSLKPNCIVVSVQHSTHLSSTKIAQCQHFFPNTVVTYCSLLPDSLRAVEKIFFILMPLSKYHARFQIIRMQQHAPSTQDDKHQIVRTHSAVFDEQYFTDYYEPMTGAFSQSDLMRNKRWFEGWFRALNSWYNFRKGEGKKVLEIGCSIGAAADILNERGFNVTATDISHYAVQSAKKLLPHIDFQILDIDQPPTTHNQYDLIYAFEVIEHLEDPRRCLTHMHQLLKPGGVLICSTPFPYPYVYFDETHISVKYPQEWTQILKECNFREVKYRQIGFVPFLYRLSHHFHIILPFGVDTKYINSPVFLYGKK